MPQPAGNRAGAGDLPLIRPLGYKRWSRLFGVSGRHYKKNTCIMNMQAGGLHILPDSSSFDLSFIIHENFHIRNFQQVQWPSTD